MLNTITYTFSTIRKESTHQSGSKSFKTTKTHAPAHRHTRICKQLLIYRRVLQQLALNVDVKPQLQLLICSIFLNDFESSFIADGAVEYHFGELSLFFLLYADDLVLFSETVKGLKNVLNKLNVYANKWHLTVNTDKTHVIFRNGGKVKDFETWTYMNSAINSKDEFCNLGILFRYNNKFSFLQKHLAG